MKYVFYVLILATFTLMQSCSWTINDTLSVKFACSAAVCVVAMFIVGALVVALEELND